MNAPYKATVHYANAPSLCILRVTPLIIMDALSTIPTVTHVISQALTRVFLLGGVGAILNVLTGRLARIVDRFRFLSESIDAHGQEMLNLPIRVRLIHWAITLGTVCSLFVCTSIVVLIIGSELGLNLPRVIAVLFIAAMPALTGGLLCFLREIALATKNIKINKAC